MITDLDFVDDIALVTEKMKQAQYFLHHVQHNVAKTGLHLNASKTEFMSFNQEQETVLKSINKENIKKVDNFKDLAGAQPRGEEGGGLPLPDLNKQLF